MTQERTFIVTTPLEGVRPLAYQGVQAITCHAQLISLLEDRLTPAHAAFLAEPLVDSGSQSADWYTPAQGDVCRLDSLPPEQQQLLRARIAELAEPMQALSAELMGRPDSNSKMAGTQLELALNYPSEDCLYCVGTQPVLTCWGCAPGNAAAAPEPLTRLAAITPPPPPPPPKEPAPTPTVSRRPRFPWWILFFLLGFILCALLMPWLLPRLGLPVLSLDLLPSGCAPARLPQPGSEEFNFAQDKEKALRAELERLRAEYAQRLAACPPPPVTVEPPPEPEIPPEPEVAALPVPEPKPTPPPEPKPEPKKEQPQNLEIPDNPKDMSFLKGCWLAGKGLLKNTRTGLPVAVKYCFDANGRGDALIQEYDNRGRKIRECKGTATARLTADRRLHIDDNQTIVCPDGSRYNRTQAECIDRGGSALCSRTNPPHNWKDVPFTKTTR